MSTFLELMTVGGCATTGQTGPVATEHGRPAPQRVFWEWCRSAPAAGSGLAMNNIGGLYEEGDGVPQDYTKAKEWFGKAAASGDPLAEKLARQYLANLTVQGH